VRSVGARVRDERRIVGLTQRQLAAAARVSLGFIRDLEQGRFGHPNRQLVGRVTDALGLDARQREVLVRADPEHAGRRPAPEGNAATTDAACDGAVTGLRVNILGLVTVAGDGGAERSGLGGAPAALLGLLALHVNAAVSRHAIVDALWGERPPDSAIGIVYTYISRLRSVLDAGPRRDEGCLVRDGSGYRLNLADGELDLLGLLGGVVSGFCDKSQAAAPSRAFVM
jgi:transcriptional regulator with XRE-family HTH domain